MNPTDRFIAKVPLSHTVQNIQWLILEEDIEHTGGWYLYGHETLDQGSNFDSWHLTREDAEKEARQDWGITEHGWRKEIKTD